MIGNPFYRPNYEEYYKPEYHRFLDYPISPRNLLLAENIARGTARSLGPVLPLALVAGPLAALGYAGYTTAQEYKREQEEKASKLRAERIRNIARAEHERRLLGQVRNVSESQEHLSRLISDVSHSATERDIKRLERENEILGRLREMGERPLQTGQPSTDIPVFNFELPEGPIIKSRATNLQKKRLEQIGQTGVNKIMQQGYRNFMADPTISAELKEMFTPEYIERGLRDPNTYVPSSIAALLTTPEVYEKLGEKGIYMRATPVLQTPLNPMKVTAIVPAGTEEHVNMPPPPPPPSELIKPKRMDVPEGAMAIGQAVAAKIEREAELRAAMLEENPNVTEKEIRAAIAKEFPKVKISRAALTKMRGTKWTSAGQAEQIKKTRAAKKPEPILEPIAVDPRAELTQYSEGIARRAAERREYEEKLYESIAKKNAGKTSEEIEALYSKALYGDQPEEKTQKKKRGT